MRNNLFKKLIAILVVALSVFTLTGCTKTYSGKLPEGKASDPQLNISVDAPILVRTVEMVQNYTDESGTRLVFANYLIENENNPSFPTDITSKVFYDPSISLNGEAIDESVIEVIAGKYEGKKLENLGRENGNAFNLTGDYSSSAYVTASDDYKLGDIRVTYTYLEAGTEVSVTVDKK